MSEPSYELFHGKRLLHPLHLSLQRHEQAFGMLETGVNKSVINRPPA